MYKVMFCWSSDASSHPTHSFYTMGSLDQIIEGARVKSLQRIDLRGKQWDVRVYQDGAYVCSRAMKNGEII